MDGEMIGYIVVAVIISVLVNLLVEKIKDYWLLSHTRNTTNNHDGIPNPPPPRPTPVQIQRHTNTQTNVSTGPRPLPSRRRSANDSIYSFPQCPVCRVRNKRQSAQRVFRESNDRLYRCINNHQFEL